MKLLHITSITNPNGNGVAIAVSNYFMLEKAKIDVAVFNVEKDVVSDKNSFNISQYKSITSLPNGFNKPDMVIFHEIYKPSYIKLYKECIKKNIPYIIVPHGCITEKSQSHNKIKKIVANILFFNNFIDKSVSIQYLNENERDESIIKKHKYIISGNGIYVSNEKNKSINKNLVFIGRYDIKVKGLDLIVNTVVENKKWFIDNNVKILLYGRNTGNGYENLYKMIEKNDISSILVLNDAIYGDDKKKLLLESYAFLQVSRHEGQPMGILEALSFGVPCIVTYETSFGNYVNRNQCGIGINFDSKELFSAIERIVFDRDFRNKCAFNSNIVEKDYNWENVINNCLKEYKELL